MNKQSALKTRAKLSQTIDPSVKFENMFIKSDIFWVFLALIFKYISEVFTDLILFTDLIFGVRSPPRNQRAI